MTTATQMPDQLPGSTSPGSDAIDSSDWDDFVERARPGSHLQTSAWAQVKAANGWSAHRFLAATDEGRVGAQLLFRQPRGFPWQFAYAPRGPVMDRWTPETVAAFTAELRNAVASVGRTSHVRIEPEIELDGPDDDGGRLHRALRAAGWRPGTPIQPTSTRAIDLRREEPELWGDLRKKWRQYVNRARRDGIRVVDAGPDRLDEFYEIYVETAGRAGFLIRTLDSYREVWDAFAGRGMARLLFAQDASGTPQATLFLVRCGTTVIEPYGGMTAAGAESRANYLLKWEAIRSSREAGAETYDLWGLSHEGIAHFKAGFGGRVIRYVGAWDLVLDPFGRLAFETAQRAMNEVGRLRHGLWRSAGDDGRTGGEASDAGGGG